MAVSVFFAYSQVDESLRNQIATQLSLLKRQRVIDTWHARRIGAGEEFAEPLIGMLKVMSLFSCWSARTSSPRTIVMTSR